MFFIVHPRAVAELKSHLEEVRRDSASWTTYYRHRATGEEWIEYWPYSEDRGPSVLRKLSIPTDVEKFLEACLGSPSPDDWYGAAAHLSSRHTDGSALLEVLRRRKNDFPAVALRRFGECFMLPDSRKIVGMTAEQVSSSYRAFRALQGEIRALTQTA